MADNPENSENTETTLKMEDIASEVILDEPKQDVVSELEQVPKPAPKRTGRPAGVKDTKPRAKRQPRVKAVTIEEEVLPRALPESRPIPTSSYDDKSAMMLELLRLQATSRQQRKVDQWNSWFQ